MGRLGRVLGRLGRILERLGGLVGRLGGVLERLGRILERLGGILGRLGRVLGRAALREPVRRECDAGAARAPTASWCPQEPPVSKNTSIQDTSTG